jgi:hypothetical protein
LELSSVCVVDAKGKIVKEAKVASEPDALVSFLQGLGLSYAGFWVTRSIRRRCELTSR